MKTYQVMLDGGLIKKIQVVSLIHIVCNELKQVGSATLNADNVIIILEKNIMEIETLQK